MKRIELKLAPKNESELKSVVGKGKKAVREVTRAQILLLAHSGKKNDEIAETLHINRDTVFRVKKRFIEGGLNKAIHDAPRPGQPSKYSEKAKAEVIALACSSPPEGRKRWTVRLIAEELKKRPGLEGINREVVRVILKKRYKAMEEKDVVHTDNRRRI